MLLTMMQMQIIVLLMVVSIDDEGLTLVTLCVALCEEWEYACEGMFLWVATAAAAASGRWSADDGDGTFRLALLGWQDCI